MTESPNPANIHAAYKLAQERYAQLGVDTDAALKQLAQIPISLHCWQGDDVICLFQSGVETLIIRALDMETAVGVQAYLDS